MAYEVTATDEEWRNNLGPDRFAVLRQAATEPPFTAIRSATRSPSGFPAAASRVRRSRGASGAPTLRPSRARCRVLTPALAARLLAL